MIPEILEWARACMEHQEEQIHHCPFAEHPFGYSMHLIVCEDPPLLLGRIPFTDVRLDGLEYTREETL